MVVGKDGAVVEAVTLRARPTVVRASGRACKVRGSTPLAALAAALDSERIGWHLRDFGGCERGRAGSSGQLFVDRIATERNRGQDGWVYKVNDFARTVGAADVAGRRTAQGRPRAVALLRAGPRDAQLPALAAARAGRDIRTAGRTGARARARV